METWKTVVPILSRLIAKNDDNSLKQLYTMIQNTVLYADIGIMSTLPDNEENHLLGLNSWLIYITIQSVVMNPVNEE